MKKVRAVQLLKEKREGDREAQNGLGWKAKAKKTCRKVRKPRGEQDRNVVFYRSQRARGKEEGKKKDG